MTRYDPFAWGEVRLDSNKQNQAGGSPPDTDDLLFAEGESVKQAPPADSSWSLLDEDVGGLLPGASPNTDEAAEFGAEILGEGTSNEMLAVDPVPELMGGMSPAGTMDHLVEQPMASELDTFGIQPALEPPSVREAEPQACDAIAAHAMPMPSLEIGSTDPSAEPRKRREVRPRRPAASYSESAPERPLALAGQPKAKSKPLPSLRRFPALAAVVPVVLCAGGGTAGAWLWVMQGNPVMAGIIAAATLVSALFSWLFLRG